MKSRIAGLASLVLLTKSTLSFSSNFSVPASLSNSVSSGPAICFEAPVFDFGKVFAGSVLKRNFVFTNTGSEILVISNVLSSCGCTTAGTWSRQVEPGKTGTIPIQFNSASFGGSVKKSILVLCNDKSQPTFNLQLKGTVSKPIDVEPRTVVIQTSTDSGSNANAIVRILNNLDQPLALSAPEGTNRAFSTELNTVQTGKEFQLIVKTVPPLQPGTLQDRIAMKTSWTNLPVLEVTAFAVVQPTVVVTPPQIVLSSGPLSDFVTYAVSIKNTGTNPLTLSEPVTNAKDAQVRIREVQSGRIFALNLTLPKGFEVTRSENIEVSIKSSHPQFPVIKVPVCLASHSTPTGIQSHQPVRAVPVARPTRSR